VIPKQDLNLNYILEAFRRRFWYVAIPFFVIFLGSILYCVSAPIVFKAQTSILVEPQKVPGEYVSSTVTIDLHSRLRTITQQIKSRTRLEKIIHEYDLYPEIREEATMTDAVEAFRSDIEINVRGGNQAFEVAYQGRNPAKVRDVTNTIANLFIEDNLKLREAQAAGTTLFLDREMERLKQILQERDRDLREFKEKYMGLLPEHMPQNHQMMSHLQQQLDSVNTTLQQTKDRRILLEGQLNNLRRMQAQVGAEVDLPDTEYEESLGRRSPDLAELQARLKSLRTRYSDKHPDVRKTKAAIAKLEKGLVGTPEASGDVSASNESGTGSGDSLFSEQIRELVAQIKAIDMETKQLLQKKDKIEAELNVYLQRVEDGPKIEQMLLDLRRGYAEVDQNYRSLLDKKFKAKLAENLEVAQQGEQFTILDHARLPDKPYKPNKRQWIFMGFVMALSAGLGLGIVLEYLDSSFFSTKELEAYTGFPVLASIPVILTDADRKRTLLKKAVSAAVLLSMACILIFALYFLWKMDPMTMASTQS
jgi:polysaccharide chain length determinant protein (PEP-CTERM system associated)